MGNWIASLKYATFVSIHTTRVAKTPLSTINCRPKDFHMHDEYEKAAARYDSLLTRPLHSIRSSIAGFAISQQAKSIIDLCCGTGEQLQMLSGSNLQLTGVDLSPAMLAVARKKNKGAIKYLESDASATGLPSHSFDIAMISFALHEKPASLRSAIFCEAKRLVKKTGTLIIAEYSVTPAGILAALCGNILIPIIERSAGADHYRHYRDWMNKAAIGGFLQTSHTGSSILISSHLQGCIQIRSAQAYSTEKSSDET